MKHKKTGRMAALLSAAAVAFAIGANAGTTNVNWENPDEYTDLGTQPYDNTNVDRFKKEMEAYLERMAQDHLPDGSVLSMNITDVNLAGEIEPWTLAHDVRIVRDVYPPKMRFTYKVTEDGRVLDQGKKSLSDIDFSYNIGRRFASEDEFFYEKEMIGEWIRNDLDVSS